MKRVIAILLILGLMASLTIGCGQSKDGQATAQTTAAATASAAEQAPTEAASDNPFPIVKDKVTLKVFRVTSPLNGMWNDLDMMKFMEEKTNVHWEEINATYENYIEKKNIAIASGDLPDVFFMCTTAAEEDKYGPEGTFLALDELIAKNGPHITKQFELNPGLKKATTSLDGKIYSLGTALGTTTAGSYKMYINTQWIKALGMQKPKTVDEFYNVLKAFKEKDPNGNKQADEIPFGERGLNNVADPTLMGWFGEAAPADGFYVNVKGGKVNFAYATEGYKAYLEFMAKLYKEKLLDSDYFTNTPEQITAKIKDGKVGFTSQAYLGDWKQYEIQEPLTSAFASKPQAIPVDKYYTGSVVITKACTAPDVVIKWFDIFFRDESEMVEGCYGPSLNYGRKGVDWDYKDADKKVWDYVFSYPEGENSYLVSIKTRVLGWSPGMIVNMANSPDPYMKWVGDGNLNFYYPYMDEESYYPAAVRFSDAESKDLGIKGTDLKTAVDEFKAKVITGQETTASWDKYIEKLKSIGMDEYVSIKQAAYDRYNSFK